MDMQDDRLLVHMNYRKYTPENIVSLEPNEVFVFGSNTEGIHGAGAARAALDLFGAKFGQAEGLQGQSYAIVTKDLELGMRSIPLGDICKSIFKFLEFAKENGDKIFYVTKLGCALAGYSIDEIGKLFMGFNIPNNVVLPVEFWEC
jgi:hypothetical protein